MGGPGRWVCAALLLVPAVGRGDEVHLRSGGVVRGVVVERTKDAVVIEAGPGRVTLPLSHVVRIVDGASVLATFQQRAHEVDVGDVGGLADLARWAADHGLATQARSTWERVLALDPSHPQANAALGRVRLGGSWMAEPDAYRARGLVRFGGRWVTSAEQETLQRERAERERVSSERREAELRVREAEARAREAEARAREAEAQAGRAEEPVNGIPYWWVLAGGGGPVWLPGSHPRSPALVPDEPVAPAPPPVPRTTPRPAPRSIWGTAPPHRPHGRSSPRPSRPDHRPSVRD
jgi:hypothetical protein